MVELDAVREHVHRPFLTHPAQHVLDLILIEAVQGHQRKSLIKARPAKEQQRVRSRPGNLFAPNSGVPRQTSDNTMVTHARQFYKMPL
jgi:hypothetical protein